METPIPRLRLSRNSHSQPGPSRISPSPPVYLNSDQDDDTPVDTQKLSPVDTPAARLRALLSRVPNHSSTVLAPPDPSEIESDFDTPLSALATPSIARESLKDLFSRALRDTPQKATHRRNSFDASEVDASPRLEKERAKIKGKRKSLSDEELDKPSRSSQRSDRSSQAATFNLLRERLSNSRSHDSDLDFSQSSPPAATSTPQRSVLLPSRSQFESNLLDHDSEMQIAMKGLDSYDDSGPTQRPVSFPPLRNPNPPLPHRPSHSKSHSHDSTHSSQHSRSSSRASSSHSAEHKEREREREWNKPHHKTFHEPSHRHSHDTSSRSVSPMIGHTLSRRASVVSLRSHDDGSMGSQADYRERIDELERERNVEREREWNKCHPNVVRPTSTLGLYADRTRAHSHAPRPDSALRGRHSVSPAPSSPSSSLASRESVREQADEVRHEVEHQLERNWNSPRPKPSTTHSSPHARVRVEAESPKPVRVRAESLKASGSRPEPALRPTASVKEHSLTSTGRQTPSRLHRPTSPLPLSPPAQTDGSRYGWQFPRSRTPIDRDPPPGPRSPTPSTRSPGRMSGSSRIPVKSTMKSHELPSISMSMSGEPSARNGDSKRGHKRTTTELSKAVGRIPPYVNDPGPFVPFDNNSGSDTVPIDDSARTPTSESDREGQSEIGTPTIGPLDTPRAAPLTLHHSGDESRLQKALASSAIAEEPSPLPSPPSDTPPSPPSPVASILSTPPRRPSFSATRGQFQTPSPPNGLPDLPDPPSFSDDEAGATPPKPTYDLTAMKTPRPPGAWASTPTFRHSPPNPRPEESNDSRYELGLATPVASVSRATPLPPQTPAPPGGWMSTPHRRSILKVRFDVEPSENSVEEGASESARVPGDLKEPPWAWAHAANGDVTPANVEDVVRARTPEPQTAVAPRSPRKSPSIRVVDAFGRERSVDGGGSKQREADAPENRSKRAIRVLDAMGREVEDAERSRSEEDVPLKHNEALARVRKGIADLAAGLSEADRPSEDPLDEQYLNKLDGVSRTARDARHQISQTLHRAQDAEDSLRSKFGSLRASMRKSNFLPNIYADRRHSWLPTSGWLLWSMVALQILLVLIMYRISVVRAKDMFLTTYYDPFYPDLHLYTTKPDARYHSVSAVARSRGAGQREGWRAAAADVWGDFAVVITSWQRQAWEAWGADDHAQSTSWPPT